MNRVASIVKLKSLPSRTYTTRNQHIPSSYLYFIHEKGTRHCKIGHTVNPATRRNALQVGNPNVLEITTSIIVKNGRLSELHAQYAFEDYRIRGEWYNISQKDAIDFVNKYT